jgi:prenyltransferase beta subunit
MPYKNPIVYKQYQKEYRIKNHNKLLVQKRVYRKINRLKIQKYHKEYIFNNLEKTRKRMREYIKNRQVVDTNFALSVKYRRRLWAAISIYLETGKITKSRDKTIDYKKIIEHIGKCPGERKDWNIDHIKPLCSFNLVNPQELQDAFNYNNIHWVTKEDNLKKIGVDKPLSVWK